jgi:hypothetical protein
MNLNVGRTSINPVDALVLWADHDPYISGQYAERFGAGAVEHFPLPAAGCPQRNRNWLRSGCFVATAQYTSRPPAPGGCGRSGSPVRQI